MKRLLVLLAVVLALPASGQVSKTVEKRLRALETLAGAVINVKDPRFGAKGDGVTDDTAAIQAAVSAAGSAGTVILPWTPVSYKTNGTLALPVAMNGAFRFVNHGTISYSGNGHAIEAAGGGAGQVGLVIEGGRITGTAVGLSGIHLAAFNKGTVAEVQIDGFTNGDGILIEGANGITIIDPHLRGNKNGLHAIGITGAYTGAANAIAVIGGQFFRNSQYGYWSDGGVAAAGVNIANSFRGTVFEGNGTNGVGAHVFLDGGDAEAFVDCYFEFSPAPYYGSAALILGGPSLVNSQQTRIQHSWFYSPGAISTVNLVRSVNATIADNEEVGSITNFLNTSANAVATILGPNRATTVTNYVAGPGSFVYRFAPGIGDLFLSGGISPGNGAASAQAGRIFQGSGAPNNANGNNGDAYFRTDAPAVPNQALYQRAAGAWTPLVVASSTGTITLTSGTPSTGTATVRSGALCVCTNATAQANPVKCAVSTTTLTATGPNTVTDSVTYVCF